MFAEFYQEYCGDEVMETTKGFVHYRYLNEKQVYIINIYVRQEYRRSKEASILADAVCDEAKNRGCSEVLGTVSLKASHSDASMKVLAGYGMKAIHAHDDVITYSKEI